MKNLYRFYWDKGRMGYVTGTFVAEESEITAAIGKQVYFGEILGKHSDIYGILKAEDLTILTDDQDFIEKFSQLHCESGHNPLYHLNEDEPEG